MIRALRLAGFAAIVLAASLAWADGMIVPVRPDLPVRGHWSVKHHDVRITVRDQVATVHIDQAFVNHGPGDLEVEYLFPLPPGAAIDSMTLLVDGKELPGKLMEAKEAKKIYEDIVRRKKDPALLEYVGYGLYRTRAFPLQPNKPASVVVSYTAVCKKDNGLVEVFYPLNTEKYSTRPIDLVKVSVDIKADSDITAVYSPTHDLKVERKDARQVIASYEVRGATPDTDFQVYYRAADENVGATVLSSRSDEGKDGYFMLLVSPNPKIAPQAAASKDVVVVLDHSGSMAQNNKLGQAKEAMRYVLSSLNEEDRFNVVSFSDSVESFFPKLMDANKKNVQEATDILARVETTGGTNIGEALLEAFRSFEKGGQRPGYLMFLTDGLPTVGERDEGAILKSAQKANPGSVRLFALGVGYDVNVRLIDNLVRTNRGISDYVKPAEPLEARIAALANKIRKPVVTDLKMSLADARISMQYPPDLGDLFDGAQIVAVGRYDKGGKTKLKIAGTLGGKQQVFEYPVELDAGGSSIRYKFVERLWAMRRIGYLLDQVQLSGESKEVVDELIRLSKEYGIMTPYTAFLADENMPLNRPADMRLKAGAEMDRLSKANVGSGGQNTAMMRKQLNEAEQAAGPAGPSASAMEARDHDEFARRGEAGQGAPGILAPTARPNSVGQTAAGRAASATAAPAPSMPQYGYSSGEKYDQAAAKEQGERVGGVQNVGGQTLYRRGQIWLAPGAEKLDLERDKDKIKLVERFTDEYFELVRANTVDENRILATQKAGEELLINFRGQFYRIR